MAVGIISEAKIRLSLATGYMRHSHSVLGDSRSHRLVRRTEDARCVPSSILKYLPSAPGTEPKTLRANNWLTTATRGAFLSSCQERALPASNDVAPP